MGYIYMHTQPQPLCDMMEYLNMNVRISPIDIEDIIHTLDMIGN